MTEPYQCSKCGETLIKSEIRLSRYGYPIPTNYYDGALSKRGENHRCPKYEKIQKPIQKPESEGGWGMHEYMRRHAKLEGKDWILYVDDKRTGFVIEREAQ